MKRTLWLVGLIGGFVLASLALLLLSEPMDPLRHAPELKSLLVNARKHNQQNVYRYRGAIQEGVYPGAVYHMPIRLTETESAFKAKLLPVDGWKVQFQRSPWPQLVATKTDATGNVVCELDVGEEGERIDPSNPSSGWDSSYISIHDPSRPISRWRLWVYETLRF